MSQIGSRSPPPSCGRGWMRWSVGGQAPGSPTLMAGLPVSRAWVRVAPPFSASGESRVCVFHIAGSGQRAAFVAGERSPQ